MILSVLSHYPQKYTHNLSHQPFIHILYSGMKMYFNGTPHSNYIGDLVLRKRRGGERRGKERGREGGERNIFCCS